MIERLLEVHLRKPKWYVRTQGLPSVSIGSEFHLFRRRVPTTACRQSIGARATCSANTIGSNPGVVSPLGLSKKRALAMKLLAQLTGPVSPLDSAVCLPRAAQITRSLLLRSVPAAVWLRRLLGWRHVGRHAADSDFALYGNRPCCGDWRSLSLGKCQPPPITVQRQLGFWTSSW